MYVELHNNQFTILLKDDVKLKISYNNNFLVILEDLDYEDCDESQIKRVTEDGKVPVSREKATKFISIWMNL